MIRITCALLFCLPLFVVGCSSSKNGNMVESASDEAKANYDKLIAEANNDVEAEEKDGAFDE